MRKSIVVLAAVVPLILSVPLSAAESSPGGRHLKLRTVDIALSSDGSAVTTLHMEMTADNGAAAMSLGQVPVAYNTVYQSLEILDAYTQKADGRKIPVDVSAIYDQLPPGSTNVPMFTDMHVKDIVFPQFAAGDTVVYTARITTKRALFPGQFWYGELFPPEAEFDEVRETLTAPKGIRLYIESHDVGFEKSEESDKTLYRWHYSAPVPKPEELVAVLPLSRVPRFFITTFPDYAALGRAYAEAAAPEAVVTPAIQALADSVAKGANDRREVARRLYEWVTTHIRYVAVEIGRGSIVPHPADTVVTNGYGDCKDHVVLLAALLKAKGIDSEGVLIDAGNAYALSDVATFTGLNHIITYVPSLDLFLDSTAVVAPFGVLPFQEYGKPVVFASETKSRLGVAPVLPARLASAHTTTVSRLTKEGVLSGTTTTTATGPYAIALRLEGLGIQSVGSQAAARRLLTAYGYGNNATGTLDMPQPTELGESYAVTGTFSSDSWTKEVAGERFFLPGGMRLLGLSGDGLMGRFGGSGLKPDAEMPCYSASASEELSLEPPSDLSFSSVPSDVHVKTQYLTFDAHWTLANGTLSVKRSFESHIDVPLCTAAIRAANASAIDQINDSYDVQISLSPKAAAR